jgi:hypothetical protein
MKITEPGIFRDIAEADYRADPCPTPSFTQSLCKVALDRSMRAVWTASPSLNPAYEPEDNSNFDLGSVAHRLVLGRGKDFYVVDFSDWRTKVAQQLREHAICNGKVPILHHQHEQAVVMTSECYKQLARHEDADAFTNGAAEVMIAWQEDGIWFRSLIDWLHDDLRTVDDYKSTGMSVAPHLIGFRAEAGGWDLQAAFIERGLDILDPAGAGRRRFRFIAQETDLPHDLTVMRINEHWLTMGRKKVEAGLALWKRAIKSGKWPSYPSHSVQPDYPGFRERSWLDRELTGEFDTSLIMAG